MIETRALVFLKWEIDDEVLDLVVSGHIVPYWPGVRYYPDGSGQPSEGGYIEDLIITRADGKPIPEEEVLRLEGDDVFNEVLYEKAMEGNGNGLL